MVVLILLVLGLILGPLADENLRRTLLVYENNYIDLLTRPVAFILLLAIILSIFFAFRKKHYIGDRLSKSPFS